MVSIDDNWKLDKSCKFETFTKDTNTINPYEELQKAIQEKKIAFINESKQWLDKKVIDETEFKIRNKRREKHY